MSRNDKYFGHNEEPAFGGVVVVSDTDYQVKTLFTCVFGNRHEDVKEAIGECAMVFTPYS